VCCCVLCECVCVYLCILWCVDGLVVSCVVRTAGYVFGGTYPQWGRIAQSVERSANNAVVLGSSPSMTISLRIYAFIDSYVLTLVHPCFLYTLQHRSTTTSEVRSLPCTLYEVFTIANNIWYFGAILYYTALPHTEYFHPIPLPILQYITKKSTSRVVIELMWYESTYRTHS
jgi:hypothetical protein